MNHTQIYSNGGIIMGRTNDFDEKLVVTIEKVLKKSFGESSLLIYSWLKIHSVNSEEIPEKLDAFSNSLKTFSAGGLVIETIILRDLYSSFGRKFEPSNKNYNFKDHVVELKNSLKH
jgi:hypothetical protein